MVLDVFKKATTIKQHQKIINKKIKTQEIEK